MSKRSMSVTLEESTIQKLQTIAVEEMRSVSNLIDYIVAQYAKKYDILSASQKLNNEIEFSKKIKITPYPETQKALENNVKIDDEDMTMLTSIMEESV